MDKPLTGCKRAVNGILLSRRCNLQENCSTGDPLKDRDRKRLQHSMYVRVPLVVRNGNWKIHSFLSLPIQEVNTIWILLKCLLLIRRMQINPCFSRKADSYEMKGGILGMQTAPWQVWCPRQSLAVYVDNGETHPCCYGDNIDFWWWKALSRCGLVCAFTGLGNYGLNLSHLRCRSRIRVLLFNLFFTFSI